MRVTADSEAKLYRFHTIILLFLYLQPVWLRRLLSAVQLAALQTQFLP